MNHNNIENIIFDLGGVIINLDIDKTFHKFSELFHRDIRSEIFSDDDKNKFFRDYETGKIDDEQFRSLIAELAGFSIPDNLIDEAWNAMLMDIPLDRIDWIYQATQKYNCVVLSNTNHIHVNHFEEFFNKVTRYGYPEDFFQNLYYSFEIGERKPDTAAFEHVLVDTGFDPAKTVLFDDLKENLATAKDLGIQTEYVERNRLSRDQLLNGRA